jgi:peptidoglycan/LPS O-acetylase OafA/YrhL
MSKALSQFLDAARWIAALAVLLGHGSVMINISDIMVGPHGPGVYAWWFLTAFWHPAVVVFFVISGFLVGGSALKRLRAPRPMLRDFYIDRFGRVYIVFLPALALGVCIDTLGRALFPHSGLYETPLFQPFFEPKNILTALIQQQGLWGGQVGANGPLWSLAMEFWYYVTFPLLMLPLSRYHEKNTRFAAAVLGLALVTALTLPGDLVGFNFLFGYAIWGLGCAASQANRPIIRSKWLSLGLFLAAAIVVRLAVRGAYVEHHEIIHRFADLTLATLFANLLLTLRFAGENGFAALRSSIHRRFADFSFSLYVTHTPLVFFVWCAARSAFGQNWHDELPTPTHWALTFALITAALGLGYGFSLVTERRTEELRGWLRRIVRLDATPTPTLAPAPGEDLAQGL